jgi:hypothetical protein
MQRIHLLAAVIAAALTFCAAQPAFGQATRPAAEHELLKVRQEWYAAYFKGNTEVLANIEASDFVVISDRTIENQRLYTNMQNAAKAGRWFPKGATNMDDDNLRVRLQGDLAVISGSGWTKVPGLLERPPEIKTAFTEIWVKRDGRWRVMHLHFHQMGQSQQARNAQAAASAQWQSNFPTGTYTAKDQQGTPWVMDFKNNGTVMVKMGKESLAPDITYTVKDDQIEISAGTSNAMCAGKGTYKWKFDGKTLSFELVSDPHCQPRQSVLTGNKFSKQS